MLVICLDNALNTECYTVAVQYTCLLCYLPQYNPHSTKMDGHAKAMQAEIGGHGDASSLKKVELPSSRNERNFHERGECPFQFSF